MRVIIAAQDGHSPKLTMVREVFFEKTPEAKPIIGPSDEATMTAKKNHMRILIQSFMGPRSLRICISASLGLVFRGLSS
jgi:hypothetical protein